MRKRAKHARYAAELGRGVFGKSARRLAKQLEAIQDELGELQDAVVDRRVPWDRWLTGTAQPRCLRGGHDRVLGAVCPRCRVPPVASAMEIREQETAPTVARRTETIDRIGQRQNEL